MVLTTLTSLIRDPCNAQSSSSSNAKDRGDATWPRHSRVELKTYRHVSGTSQMLAIAASGRRERAFEPCHSEKGVPGTKL